MKKIFSAFMLCWISLSAFSASPSATVFEVYKKFNAVKNFKANLNVHFDIPSINISKMNGHVFYKAPDKFKIKLSGVAFLPKQNPFETFNFLSDTTAFIAVQLNTEMLGNTMCLVISILPKKEQDIVMEKLWIGQANHLIMKAEVTSKSNGVVKSEYFYSNQANISLPEKIIFSIDLTKFKLPKMIAVDLNSKKKTNVDASKKEVGKIEFLFLNYEVNKGVKPDDFEN